MTGRMGQQEGLELWLRCPFCGDSEHDPEKAHFSINLRRFYYHCFRCQVSGKLSAKQVFQLMSQLSGDFSYDILEDPDDQTEDWPELTPGPGSSRPSALSRYHFIDKKGIHWDAFYMRHPKDNNICGVHIRNSKHKLSLGDKGLNWSSPEPLRSDPESPIRLVEGPYDVVDPEDVCVFGLIAYKSIRDLAGHSVVLCPDGDVWLNHKLFQTTVRTINWLLKSSTIYLTGLEYIPDGKDPDEVVVPDRGYIPRPLIMNFIRQRWEALPEYTAKEKT